MHLEMKVDSKLLVGIEKWVSDLLGIANDTPSIRINLALGHTFFSSESYENQSIEVNSSDN